MLPGIDGYQVCRELRASSQVPIIMLSAKGEIFDKVLGLELGADDYMIKPFDSKELVARVKAVLRRYQTAPGATASSSHAGCRRLDQISRMSAFSNRAFCGRRHEIYLAVLRARQHHNAVAQLLLHLIAQTAQAVHIHALHRGR